MPLAPAPNDVFPRDAASIDLKAPVPLRPKAAFPPHKEHETSCRGPGVSIIRPRIGCASVTLFLQ